jgi:hypothetical protein
MFAPVQVLGMSYEFYEGQMSGSLPAWNRLLYSKGGWKKPAHLNDGSPIAKDLSGGYYDAGDYLKCPHALAWGVSNLIMSLLEFRPAYDASGNYAIAVNHVRWALDWLLKAHVRAGPAAADNAFVGQVRVVGAGWLRLTRRWGSTPNTTHGTPHLRVHRCQARTTTSTLAARSTLPTSARSTWPTRRAQAPTWRAR